MKVKYQGNARVDFELLKMRTGEMVNDYFRRVLVVSNDMRNCDEDMLNVKIVEKSIRTLTEKFNYIVCSIEESKDIGLSNFRKSGGEEQALKVSYEERGSKGRGAATRGWGRGGGRQINKDIVECYKCHQLGHFQYKCSSREKKANYTEVDEEEEMLLKAFMETNNAYKRRGVVLRFRVQQTHVWEETGLLGF
ncbi:hypothetical protein K2173_023509 [Erythroxylum novogranatense]|uniref:CCHC-type domain-containing protein n=1 Tax=Erythroxylum novogranatense TaxID=1862640 RepID=A0AAV8TQR7_9ROSI|nr:hypothetical protein K2173_023509 [Erythroxylum novogranatense]